MCINSFKFYVFYQPENILQKRVFAVSVNKGKDFLEKLFFK